MKVERHPITDRETWLAMRRRDITASDIGAVCGVEGERTAATVWAEKLGIMAPESDNAAMRRGRWFESGVLDGLREARPTWAIRTPNVYLRAPEHRLGCTPDAFAIDPERDGEGIVQIKTAGRFQFDRRWGGEPPLAYQLQTLTEAMLWGASWAVLVVGILSDFARDDDIRIFEVPRHAGAESRILASVASYWEDVDAGRQPRLDYTRDQDVVAALYPQDDGSHIDLSGDNELPGLLAEWVELRAQEKAIKQRLETLKAIIGDKMGRHETATAQGFRIRYGTRHLEPRTLPATSYRALTITDKRKDLE